MKSLLIALLVVALGAAPARADRESAALKLYERGEKLYAEGKYEPALKAFRLAYAKKPIPALYINIGQCFRKLGKHDLAINAFERYLAEEPEGDNRAAVEELLAEERAQLAPEPPLEPAPEPAPESAPEPAAESAPAEPAPTVVPEAAPVPAARPAPASAAAPASPPEDDGAVGMWIILGGTAVMVLTGGTIAAVVALQPVVPEPTGSLGQFDLRR